MNLVNYLEAVSRDITDINRGNVRAYVWIVFDLETTGLIGSQGLKLQTGKKYKDEKGRERNVYSNKDLEIAEIAVYAYDPSTKKRFSFHEFLKVNEMSEEIKNIISWNDVKESLAKDSLDVLKKLNRYLGFMKNRKKIIIAHNGTKYDFKIMSLMGQKFNLQNIKEAFSLSPDENTILIDTLQTQKIRQKLSKLPWPKKVLKNGKVIDINSQNDLLDMFGIKNIAAHTAIEDVSALVRYLLKILRMLTKK